ncbi:MAG: alpha/beta fold hydrolase [Candidatus Eremiobacteraeota bacterium]|nr:alpha/beta fold hydrolase [Candidatus Eremiobacteraeota bacterium]
MRGATFFTVLAVVTAGCAAAQFSPSYTQNTGAHAPAIAAAAPTLRRCLGGDYYCGTVRVPLDPARQVKGKIGIAFALRPHSDQRQKTQGTIVAVEGGPGYPSIGSRSLYRALYAPLLKTRDLIMVDNRGTGRSEAIYCEALQRAPVMRLPQVTQCGAQLVRRSDLYGTAIGTDDLAAVLDALHVAKVDIYGDSYGSFFVQAFAGRHPRKVRTIVLDGAYQVVGGSAWYPSTGPTLQSAFDLACERSPVCAALPGSSMDRIRALLKQLRDEPSTVTPSGLAFVMDTAGLDPIAYRDLDAAARAYVNEHDRVPLERLVDEAYSQEEGAGGRARSYSQGLFAAASCSDNPQAYDMRLPPTQRMAQWRRVLERKRDKDPRLYAPFTIDEFLGMPIDYSYVPLCLTWPVPSRAHPPGQPVPPATEFPNVPVLVLNGDLDTITTPAEGAHAAELFPRATHVIVANTGHVTALGDYYGCASSIVRTFTESQRVDRECAARVPALHLVPSFARTVNEVTPATPLPGNGATPRELRTAAAAALAAADVVTRAYQFGLASGSGLRGGAYSATATGTTTSATLTQVRWTNDVDVSGTARLDARTANVSADVALGGAAGGTLHAAWKIVGSAAQAQLTGTIDGNALHATMPAP